MPFDFDLLVIGAGSAGVRVSRMAAQRGLRVAVVENQALGGTCVNVGCVPKKLLVYASEYPNLMKEAQGYGFSPELAASASAFNWQALIDNKTNEIKRLNGIYNNLLKNSGVTILTGFAQIEDAHTVRVQDQLYRAERIVIATGGWPVKPDIVGSEYGITSNEAFYLPHLPKRIMVIGGGYIAVEFAGIFNGLGSAVQLVYRGEHILREFDAGIRTFAAEQIAASGIQVRTNLNVERIERLANGVLRCDMSDGQQQEVDCVMFATGRKPNTDGLNLAEVGVATRDNGTIIVNDAFQTSVPSIYALGDVIGTKALTPIALAQAMSFLSQWLDGAANTLNYRNVATAVFCQPNIATVGMTEEEALAEFGSEDVQIFETRFRPMKHTLSGLNQRTMMKLVVQRSTDLVVGAHMVGEEAGEIIQGLSIAINAGATKAVFDRTIGIHPTAAEEFVTLRTART